MRNSAQCVPATLLPRKRRRKLPEGEAKLLDRIRHYEGLLRDHNIAFEPFKSDYLPRRTDQAAKDAQNGEPRSDGTPHAGNELHSPVAREEGAGYEYVVSSGR